MKIWIAEEDNKPVLVVRTETPDEAAVLESFELVQDPLTAEILRGFQSNSPYIIIRRSES